MNEYISTVNNKKYKISKKDVIKAFEKTKQKDWINWPGPKPYHLIVINQQEKPVKAVFRKIFGTNNFVTFYAEGTLRPCDKFPRSNGGITGDALVNIESISTINDIFSARGYNKLLSKQTISLKICDACRWRNTCKGACAFDRQLYMQSKSTEFYSECSTYKIYEHIYNVINVQLRDYHKNNTG